MMNLDNNGNVESKSLTYTKTNISRRILCAPHARMNWDVHAPR